MLQFILTFQQNTIWHIIFSKNEMKLGVIIVLVAIKQIYIKMPDDKNTYFDNDLGCKNIFLIVKAVIKLIIKNANQAII